MKSQHSTGPPIKVSHDRAYSVTYKERRKDKKQEVNGIVKFSGCIYFVGCMYSCFGRLHVFYVLSFRTSHVNRKTQYDSPVKNGTENGQKPGPKFPKTVSQTSVEEVKTQPSKEASENGSYYTTSGS